MDNSVKEEKIKELVEEIANYLDNYSNLQEKRENTCEDEILFASGEYFDNLEDKQNDCEYDKKVMLFENPSGSILFDDYKIISQIKKKIISLVGYGKAVKYESIIQYFNPNEIIRPVIEEIIDNLVKEELIESKLGYLFAGKYTLKEYLASNFDREQVIYVWLSFNGFSTYEIGNALGIRYDKVHHIEAKTIHEMKHSKRKQWKDLKEMSFSEILSSYSIYDKDFRFNDEAFLNIYNLPLIYRKLPLAIDFDRFDRVAYHDIDSFLQNEALTEELRQNYLKEFGKKLIYVGGKYQRANRMSLIRQLFADNYSLNSVGIDEFKIIYNNIIKNNNIYNYGLELPDNINTLFDNQKYLIKGIKGYRYYCFEKYNAKDLVKKLNFSNIKNLYLSSKYFFDRYPDVMEEFNLLDPYELHNYLSKTSDGWNNCKTSRVNICRIPHLEFGRVNREKQIENLLLINLPISKIDFCLLCEKEYGIQANTVNAEFHEIIRKYLDGNMLVKNTDKLSKSKFQYMKDCFSCISKEAFTEESFKKMINSFCNDDIEITNYICSNLGFRLYEGYVLKDSYATVKEYLISFESDGILSLRDQSRFELDLLKIRSFLSAVNDLKKDGFITEVEKGYYYVVDNVEWQKLRKDLSSDAAYISELNKEDKEVFKKLKSKCNAYVKRHGKVNESVIFDWIIDFDASFEAEFAFYKWVEAKGIEIEKLPRKEKNKTVITTKNITPLCIKECKDIEEFKEECLRIVNSGGLLGEADFVDGIEKFKLSDDEFEEFIEWLTDHDIELEQEDDLDLSDDIYESSDYDDDDE